MGTNYYVTVPPSCGGICATHCRGVRVHLGKQSAGWTFSFQAYPRGLRRPEPVTWDVEDFQSWRALLDLGEVSDEYGDPVSSGELEGIIARAAAGRDTLYEHQFRDAGGHRFIPGEFF